MIENSLGYLRGYKIRLFLITSDFERVENIYNENITNSIIAGCFYKIFYSAKSTKSAQKISQICINDFNKTALLSWQEILTLDDNQQILLEGKTAKISNKFFYYQDDELKARIEY
jgi:type IV secretion system protein VirD4